MRPSAPAADAPTAQAHAQTLTRELLRMKAETYKDRAADVSSVWSAAEREAIAAAPYLNVGNSKAMSQTYNAGSLFTSSNQLATTR